MWHYSLKRYLFDRIHILTEPLLDTYPTNSKQKKNIQIAKSSNLLLPTNANLGRIMRIMEKNISLLELLFVLNNQTIDINI